MLVTMPLWEVEEPDETLISSGLATMGFALPAAIAASVARPGRRVVCFTGDGGLGMALAELETVSRLGAPIVVVVFNDSALSLIEIKQRPGGHGGENAVRYRPTDFAALAQSSGYPPDESRTRLPSGMRSTMRWLCPRPAPRRCDRRPVRLRGRARGDPGPRVVRPERPERQRDERDDQQESERSPEVVADGVGREIVRMAPVEVANELPVVGSTVAQVRGGHPDHEDEETAHEAAPQRGGACGARVPTRQSRHDGDAGRAEQRNEERDEDPGLEEARRGGPCRPSAPRSAWMKLGAAALLGDQVGSAPPSLGRLACSPITTRAPCRARRRERWRARSRRIRR